MYNVTAGRDSQYTGVWAGGAKIAALGLKISKWVTMHGLSFNIDPDMRYFKNIIPCGIRDRPVTSLSTYRSDVNITDIAKELLERFANVFKVSYQQRPNSALADFSQLSAVTRGI
jgi:lipoyl(octanoyl) transferase